MGASLTRIGAGPNGETVIADSETELREYAPRVTQLAESLASADLVRGRLPAPLV